MTGKPGKPGKPRSADEADTTARTIAWLRHRRGAGQARRLGYAVYVVTLLIVGWYGLYAVGTVLRLRSGAPLADHAAAIGDVLPSALVLSGFAGWWLVVRDALWRGPVNVPSAEVDWVLSLPVRRGPVLLPWFLLSAAVWVVGGLLGGFAVALLVAAGGLGGLGPAAAACLACAFCLMLTGVVTAAAVEASETASRRLRRYAPAAAPAAGLAAVQVLAAVEGARWELLERILLWSGPWGWAAQPVLAVAGDPPPGWPAAAVLLGVATVVSPVAVPRILAAFPARVLRGRARSAGAVLAAVLALDLRAAQLSTAWPADAADGPWRRRLARMRAPRRPWLVVPWRDTVALLAAPGRLGAGVVLVVLAGGVLRVGAGHGSAYATAALAATTAYAAVSRLLEAARLDGDNAERTAWSPHPRGRIAVEHAAVPTVVLALGGAAAALGLASAPLPAAAAAVAAAPVLVAGGLLNAYRSPAPVWLFGGLLGELGPILFLLWHAAGPIAGIGGVTLLLGPLLADGTVTGVRLGAHVAGCWLLALLMLIRLRRQTRG